MDDRGYIIMALGDVYVTCAQHLRDSILKWHPQAQIKIVTINDLPLGDKRSHPELSHQANDWQAAHISPWHETIKLEADMLVTSSVEHWWDLFRHKDVFISTGCLDLYGHQSRSRYYRKVFDANHLPDVYNAITYWRKSQTAQTFWKLVRRIFADWPRYKTLLRYPEQVPTTDVVYAMAAMIMGPETVTMPFSSYPRIRHMKKKILNLNDEDWTRQLTWEINETQTKINTVCQTGCLHYVVKDWCHRV
jgi:hypothetical protein